MKPVIDYQKLGLKVGLEIHVQLDTAEKLFCDCPTSLSADEPDLSFTRRLRPTQSELGLLDEAALFEFHKGRSFVYEADKGSCCLVEMDEEPPHALNNEAIDIGLMVSLSLNCSPVDEIHVMRKIVIDGSNTTGFQRTAIISTNGQVKAGELKVGVRHISLEEDAARKTTEEGFALHYRLDRLGIPLLEITTDPSIGTPEEAVLAAREIGRILKATKRVKRGLGSIRQDLNISMTGGALTEVKGVQKLNLIGRVVEFEASRQRKLMEIAAQLKERGLSKSDLNTEITEVTEIFRGTSSKILRKALDHGGVVLGVALPKFEGLLRIELAPGVRLGSEMSDRAHFWGLVSGIFHTDELPGYGITEKEVGSLRKKLKLHAEDAGVIVADAQTRAEDALRAVIARASEAVDGVPEETRGPTAEGATRYMRPRPGSARMYPETDIPPVMLEGSRVERLRKSLPPLPDELLSRLQKEYGLNQILAERLMDSEYLPLFEKVAASAVLAPTSIATFLTESLINLEREGCAVENLTEPQIESLFLQVERGATAKESLPELARWLSDHPKSTGEEALRELGLNKLSEADLARVIEKILKANPALAKPSSERDVAKLIGLVMSEVRGKADAAMVQAVIKSKISASKY